MKKTFIGSVLLLLAAMNASAQNQHPVKTSKQFYLRIGVGYSAAHSGQADIDGLPVSGSITANSAYTGDNLTAYSTQKNLKRASFGSGINAVVAFGAILQKNIGIELGIGVGIAPQKHKYEYTENITSTAPTYTSKYNFKSTKYQKLPVLVMPAIVLQTGGQKLNIYSRLGVVLPVPGKLIEERKLTQTYSNNPVTAGQEETYEFKTRFAVGFHGALGVQLQMADNFAFFLEANGISMNAYAKKATLTKLTINGVDYLSQVSLSEKETEFDFSGDDTDEPQNTNAPSKEKTFSIPYSNVGVAIGFMVRI